MEEHQTKSEDAVVRLNVGGKPMLVAQSTLTKDAHSVLGRMFAPDAVLPPATRLDDGSYFLDYDPQCFAIVVDHLRYGTIDIDPALVGRVRCTADSLAIASLVTACDAQIAIGHARRAGDCIKQRSAECCPRCGEILLGEDDKDKIRATMGRLLDEEKNAIFGFWERRQYDRYRAMVYHECAGPLRLLRNHWFELSALGAACGYVIHLFSSPRR
ncbi:BTB/POZ domain containing protein [Pandoravirus quercus]|uniref:BTB/POZ domain containing protein n=2 Tax=Pandoravirus TaxID=2060084 RepID=A0A2U7U8V1_9VIRU|nr:BTB/POZ domain containing protein [Pandoravirus quercus]AVK74863.1 BTB/POZ domain containing protein [Pandoravirus quercus]QBZ81048.1 BTB domain containing protein [Pandoravirus celtis]